MIDTYRVLGDWSDEVKRAHDKIRGLFRDQFPENDWRDQAPYCLSDTRYRFEIDMMRKLAAMSRDEVREQFEKKNLERPSRL